MNTRRLAFWSVFLIVLALIIWGLAVAMNKPPAATAEPAAVTSSDHVLGQENAPVTLIEYSDFQCPACESYHPVVKKLYEEASTTMRFVYRHFPLPQHKNAVPAALASEAAANQGKFWEMFDLIFENHEEWTELADAYPVFERYANEIGLNLVTYKNDIASTTIKDRVVAGRDEATRLGLPGTPSFFVNGKMIANPPGYDQFKEIILNAASSSSQ